MRIFDRCGGPSVTPSPSRSSQSSRPAVDRARKSHDEPQAVVRVAGHDGVAEQLELFGRPLDRRQDLGMQLGPENGVGKPR